MHPSHLCTYHLSPRYPSYPLNQYNSTSCPNSSNYAFYPLSNIRSRSLRHLPLQIMLAQETLDR